jgi:sugar phosphate isomerase/epimerase
MTNDLVSVQLYTVRDAVKADPRSTFERLAALGFSCVELFGLPDLVDEYADGLAVAGLRAPTAHASLTAGDLDRVFEAATRLGVGTVFDPYIDENRWTARDSVELIARDLNAVARRAADQGLRIGYHNHAFEFENRFGGRSAFELLAEHLDDAVELELDTYWAVVGGETDLGALAERLGPRLTALHIKDGPLSHSDIDQVAVGDGQMNFESILAAAPTAFRVIELDDYRGDVLEAVQRSRTFLQRK